MSMANPYAPSPPTPAKPAWYKRHWVHLVGVGFLCFSFGAAANTADTSTPATESASAVSDATKALDDREAALDVRETALQKGEETAEGEADAAEDAQAKADAADEKADAAEAAAQKKADAAEAAAQKKADAAEAAAQKKADAAKAREDANTFEEGTYVVGVDIKPGTYRTAGPEDDAFIDLCYWSRLKDTDGEMGSIIANGTPGGPTTITIKSTDGAFETSSCQPWVKR